MKKILLLAILVAAIFIVGCQQQGPSVGPTFVGGTQGISVDFIQDAPPAEIFDGAQFPFSINLKMKNVGEWEIKNGADIRVKIEGIDPTEYSVTPASLQKNPPQGMLSTRRGPSGEIIEGDTIVVDFPGLNFKRELFGDTQATIKGDVCYKYGTKVSSNICIKKDLSSSETSLCSVNEVKAVANSGAPVQITSIRESQGGTDTVLLTLTIKHVGTGKVFETGSQCADELNKKDRVLLKIDTGMTGLSCTGLQTSAGQPTTGSEGYMTLFSGERQITCTQPTGGQGDFTKPVTATLEYDYDNFITKQITVKHV